MTSIIKFTALSGAKGEGPPCYLLQVDEFCFLLDCGWNEQFSMKVIENIKRSVVLHVGDHVTSINCCKKLLFLHCYFSIIRHIHQIDAILLSHPDVVHLGALPYVVGRLGLKCPIYATIPVYKMGQMFMYDLYQVLHVHVLSY